MSDTMNTITVVNTTGRVYVATVRDEFGRIQAMYECENRYNDYRAFMVYFSSFWVHHVNLLSTDLDRLLFL